MFKNLELPDFKKEKLNRIYDYLYSNKNNLINKLKDLFKTFNLKENRDYQSINFEIGMP